MDTNIVITLPKAASTAAEWTQLIPALIAAIFALAAYLQSRTIHKVVNSAQTAAIEREKVQTATILKLSQDNAALTENKRGKEVAAEVKAAALPTKS